MENTQKMHINQKILEIDQQIENAEEGTVIGPFISPENQNFASLVKVYEAGKQDESRCAKS